MLVAESHRTCCSSHQTYDTLKACLNLRVVSLAATLVFVVIYGQNESDDTRSHDSYLLSHLPKAMLQPHHHHAISFLIFKSGCALLEVYEARWSVELCRLWLVVGLNVSAWWQHGLGQNQMWLEAVMVWPKNRLNCMQQTDLLPGSGHVIVAAILGAYSLIWIHIFGWSLVVVRCCCLSLSVSIRDVRFIMSKPLVLLGKTRGKCGLMAYNKLKSTMSLSSMRSLV